MDDLRIKATRPHRFDSEWNSGELGAADLPQEVIDHINALRELALAHKPISIRDIDAPMDELHWAVHIEAGNEALGFQASASDQNSHVSALIRFLELAMPPVPKEKGKKDLDEIATLNRNIK